MNEPNRYRPDDLSVLVEQYRQHGQVEPPAELDRLIRARADQAARQPSRRRPLTWISGLATTAVLLLAVSVVLRLETQIPDAAVFEPTPAQEHAPANAREPSARFGQTVPSEQARAAADEQRAISSAPQPSPAPASPPVPVSRSERQSLGLSEQDRLRAEERDSAEPAGEFEEDKQQVDEQLQAIEQAVESGDLDGARLLLEAWQRDHPNHPALKRLHDRINALQPESG